MKKIYLMAYARKNLGDDIFMKMLLEKYHQYDFYIRINNSAFLDKLGKHSNLHILQGNSSAEELYNMNEEQYDAYVFIGGSIFTEGGNLYKISPELYDFVKRCKRKNIPFCYISSNYGPYQTNEYLESSKKIFSECTDICFRDKFSYNLFKDIGSVRYAPDYALTYKVNMQEKMPNTIGISVINLEIRKDFRDLEDKYFTLLKNNIKQYLQLGKTVYLYSFCKHEGDENTLDYILNEFKDNKNVIGVKYDGDIDKYLDLYGKMEYMICARFHAMILSSLFEQKMYVMSYSKKIDNVIQDLGLDLPILHFEEIKQDIKIDLNDFKSVDKGKITELSKEAEKQDKVFLKI